MHLQGGAVGSPGALGTPAAQKEGENEEAGDVNALLDCDTVVLRLRTGDARLAAQLGRPGVLAGLARAALGRPDEACGGGGGGEVWARRALVACEVLCCDVRAVADAVCAAPGVVFAGLWSVDDDSMRPKEEGDAHAASGRASRICGTDSEGDEAATGGALLSLQDASDGSASAGAFCSTGNSYGSKATGTLPRGREGPGADALQRVADACWTRVVHMGLARAPAAAAQSLVDAAASPAELARALAVRAAASAPVLDALVRLVAALPALGDGAAEAWLRASRLFAQVASCGALAPADAAEVLGAFAGHDYASDGTRRAVLGAVFDALVSALGESIDGAEATLVRLEALSQVVASAIVAREGDADAMAPLRAHMGDGLAAIVCALRSALDAGPAAVLGRVRLAVARLFSVCVPLSSHSARLRDALICERVSSRLCDMFFAFGSHSLLHCVFVDYVRAALSLSGRERDGSDPSEPNCLSLIGEMIANGRLVERVCALPGEAHLPLRGHVADVVQMLAEAARTRPVPALACTAWDAHVSGPHAAAQALYATVIGGPSGAAMRSCPPDGSEDDEEAEALAGGMQAARFFGDEVFRLLPEHIRAALRPGGLDGARDADDWSSGSDEGDLCLYDDDDCEEDASFVFDGSGQAVHVDGNGRPVPGIAIPLPGMLGDDALFASYAASCADDYDD